MKGEREEASRFMAQRSTKKDQHYIPGLDGLRALAVIAVIFYHLFPALLPGGYIGVDIFFVISGFLITTLLISEHARSGHISLRKFWLRRARRLLPALLVTITVVSSVVFFIRGDIMVGIGQQILGASTFSSNWVEVIVGTDYFNNNTTHLFMNFWSLAVEEQFYLLWPLVVLLIISVIKKPRIGMLITGLLAFASAGLMAYLFYHGADMTRVYYGTDTHVFGLMIGAFLAFWSRTQTVGQATRRLSQPFWKLRRFPVLTQLIAVLALLGVIGLLFVLPDESPFTYNGGLFVSSILTAIILMVTVGVAGPLQKLFLLRPLAWIGIRSYGLYLWHWPLLVLLRYLLPHTLPWWVTASGLLLLTFGAAALSYRYIEMPIRQRGFSAVFKRMVKRQQRAIDGVTTRIRAYPHPAALIVFALFALTAAAVINAPTKTVAQMNVEKGQKAAMRQVTKPKPAPRTIPQVANTTPIPSPPDGMAMIAVGDSVTLASTPSLQERFPGILINAEISRSLRRGGLETIENLKSVGQLRPVVIVALGTNGYYGTGGLDEMMSVLKDYKVVLVTAHADREWTIPNNNDARIIAQKYNNVAVADWDIAISPRPDLLSSDGIHPVSADGDRIYADCIAQALKKFQP